MQSQCTVRPATEQTKALPPQRLSAQVHESAWGAHGSATHLASMTAPPLLARQTSPALHVVVPHADAPPVPEVELVPEVPPVPEVELVLVVPPVPEVPPTLAVPPVPLPPAATEIRSGATRKSEAKRWYGSRCQRRRRGGDRQVSWRGCSERHADADVRREQRGAALANAVHAFVGAEVAG